MPEYVYTDINMHTVTMTLPMQYSQPVICAACGLEMWRKPQRFRVSWGGCKPSAGDISPLARELNDGADRRRDEYRQLKELRGE